ncbi:hypothetical protein [Atlantibacter hermannii]|uniref:hypothetical protein n=1 Tax=Atlantibacter hermannii TaxID=565 RepID=UPI00289C328E|nr:hypothetical protein [Atlantibacter hermannii]
MQNVTIGIVDVAKGLHVISSVRCTPEQGFIVINGRNYDIKAERRDNRDYIVEYNSDYNKSLLYPLPPLKNDN